MPLSLIRVHLQDIVERIAAHMVSFNRLVDHIPCADLALPAITPYQPRHMVCDRVPHPLFIFYGPHIVWNRVLPQQCVAADTLLVRYSPFDKIVRLFQSHNVAFWLSLGLCHCVFCCYLAKIGADDALILSFR